MYFHSPDWELALFGWINQGWSNPLFDLLMPLFSSSALLWLVALVLAAIGLRHGRVTATVILGLALSVAASDLVCSAIKDSVGRIRPYHGLAGTRFPESGSWVTRPQGFVATRLTGSSFPSAHAANAAAATLVLFAAFRKKSLWIIPLAIGYSRIYLGKHYPMDVLAGWATGLAVAGLLLPLYPALWSRMRSRWMRYRLRT